VAKLQRQIQRSSHGRRALMAFDVDLKTRSYRLTNI
jgi:hypothetical protein